MLLLVASNRLCYTGPPKMNERLRADSLIDCMAERSARGIRSQGSPHSPSLDGRLPTPYGATAKGGDRFAIDLEFEFLSRIIASMQLMSGCRHKRRLPQMCLNHNAHPPMTEMDRVVEAGEIGPRHLF
jgi:hypothetical protein